MRQQLASRRPWLAFALSYYGLLAVFVLALCVPGLLFLLSQYVYGGPPPWGR
jgi:hypothetical protein